jgi:hypothetical protein
MSRKIPTTFPDWIREFGVNNLARECKVDPAAVSRWAKGTAQPNLDNATTILNLAKGRLKPSDLLKEGAK